MIYRLVTALSRGQKQWIFALIDALAAPLALVLAMMLTASVRREALVLTDAVPLLVGLFCVAGALTWWLGLPRVKLNAYEMRSAVRTATLAVLTAASGMLIDAVLGLGLAAGTHIMSGLILLCVAVAWRLALLHLTLEIYRRGSRRLRVLIYGAGQTGQQLVAALRHDKLINPVAFVDDNPTLQTLVVAGLRVYAPSQIDDLIAKRDIDRIVLAMPSISAP